MRAALVSAICARLWAQDPSAEREELQRALAEANASEIEVLRVIEK
jgi:hypothetical protein